MGMRALRFVDVHRLHFFFLPLGVTIPPEFGCKPPFQFLNPTNGNMRKHLFHRVAATHFTQLVLSRGVTILVVTQLITFR